MLWGMDFSARKREMKRKRERGWGGTAVGITCREQIVAPSRAALGEAAFAAAWAEGRAMALEQAFQVQAREILHDIKEGAILRASEIEYLDGVPM